MRGLVATLETPRPLIDSLPGIYQEDDLARAVTTAFDDNLAPILSTIDNVAAYLDPALTPDDFLDWLSSWVGILPDETWRAPSFDRQMYPKVEKFGDVPAKHKYQLVYIGSSASPGAKTLWAEYHALSRFPADRMELVV